jgi:hypothetical protein
MSTTLEHQQQQVQVVTTDTVANGIVKKYFKLPGILLAIGVGIGVVCGVIAMIGNIVGQVGSSDSQHSVDVFTNAQEAKAPHQLYEESTAYYSGVRDIRHVSLHQKYNSSPDYEEANGRERGAADALDTALDKLAQAKDANLSVDVIAKVQQSVTDAEAAFDKAVADHNAAYAAKKSADAQKAKDEMVRDLSDSGKGNSVEHKTKPTQKPKVVSADAAPLQ